MDEFEAEMQRRATELRRARTAATLMTTATLEYDGTPVAATS